MRIAIDTGGTFTDCVYLVDGTLQVLKVPSTPAVPSEAVLNALAQLHAAEAVEVRHGTTVGTNAMLERKGARVAFVTTAGFEDTLAIGRQTRSRLYDWFAPLPVCLVSRELRFGVPERVTAEGTILRAPTEEELGALVEQVRNSGAAAVAISLLFSFANPTTELRVEAALRSLGLPVSTSHRILPEFREYERASTTVVNAYLAPTMQRYLLDLEKRVRAEHAGGRVDVMQSSGGIIPARLAAQEPVRTVLSGPAGGVIGACRMAQAAGFDRIIGFDMGGTSTDVFLADEAKGGAQRTRESVIAGVPIAVSMLDIHTVGAGGGSIARFDSGGMLRVGPESAGSEPGPICFGRGTMPTVTDANLLLGRLDGESFLGGEVALDANRTEKILDQQKGAIPTTLEFAAGIVRVVEKQMEKAMRVISVERGHDPRECTLVAFGGGGPLHACALAQAMRIPTVLIPAMPGALSAVGILLADTVRDYSRTVMLPGDSIEQLGPMFAEMKARGFSEFAAEGLQGTPQYALDLRYRRQGYELNVLFDPQSPSGALEQFHRMHEQRYGFSNLDKPVEIVNLRLRMVAAGEPYSAVRSELVSGNGDAAFCGERDIYFDKRFHRSRVYRREQLVAGDSFDGPALVTEYTSATLLPLGCHLRVDAFGNLILWVERQRS